MENLNEAEKKKKLEEIEKKIVEATKHSEACVKEEEINRESLTIMLNNIENAKNHLENLQKDVSQKLTLSNSIQNKIDQLTQELFTSENSLQNEKNNIVALKRELIELIVNNRKITLTDTLKKFVRDEIKE